MARRIYTPEVVADIQRRLRAGEVPDAIAVAIGSTPATLKVVCSKLGIPLRRGALLAVRELMLQLDAAAFDKLRQAAIDRGTREAVLARRLLEAVLVDDLVAAVLDR